MDIWFLSQTLNVWYKATIIGSFSDKTGTKRWKLRIGDIFDKSCEELVVGQEGFSNVLLRKARASADSLVGLEVEGLGQGRDARFGLITRAEDSAKTEQQRPQPPFSTVEQEASSPEENFQAAMLHSPPSKSNTSFLKSVEEDRKLFGQTPPPEEAPSLEKQVLLIKNNF